MAARIDAGLHGGCEMKGSFTVCVWLLEASNHSLVRFRRQKDTLSSVRRLPRLRFRNACRSLSASHLPCSERHRKEARTCIEGSFGEVLRATGPMATANPFRASTKFSYENHTPKHNTRILPGLASAVRGPSLLQPQGGAVDFQGPCPGDSRS